VQVDPAKPKLKPPGTKRLKLKIDILLVTSAFIFSLRRYNQGERWYAVERLAATVRQCSLTLSIQRWNRPELSA